MMTREEYAAHTAEMKKLIANQHRTPIKRMPRPVVSHHAQKTCCGGRKRIVAVAVATTVAGASLSGSASVEVTAAG